MAQLYPPYIEGTIPAFYGDSLTVPFSMNRAVSTNEILGFSLKIKTVQNNTFIKTINTTVFDFNDLEAIFEMPTELLTLGQSYKVQLAYIDLDGAVGYYSTVGVVKYTAKPDIYIDGMVIGQVNNFVKGFIGIFNHADDPTEKEYSYRFTIADAEGNLVADSGTLLHNCNNDVSGISSQDEFTVLNDLEIDKSYFIQYIVTTNNNMVCKSSRYRIMQRETIDPEINVTLNATLNSDNGYVTVTMIGGKNSSGVEEPAVGAFLLSRCDVLKQQEWDEVFRFSLQGELPSRILWKDFTVEQGKTYIYALQQYNDFGLYSNRILSNSLYVDFEDAFLFDGERQLKIRYNPQMSSFKTDILESKLDTIGSKYPFIFRNGNVNYKEFPLSGLISYWMDEEELFLPVESLGLDDVSEIARETTVRNGDTINNTYYTYSLDDDNIVINPMRNNSLAEKNLLNAYANHRKEALENIISRKPRTTTLEGYNIAAERIFKLEVLDWLNNGKPKLFRSPSEGNYIVRLMTTSLTPTDGVNRMLHTFSSTAYEIAECNYTNLANYNFLHLETPSNERQRWSTLYLVNDIALNGIDTNGHRWYLMYDELLRDRSINNETYYTEEVITNIDNQQHKYALSPRGYSMPCRKASSIYFEGMLPGDKIYISYADRPDREHYKTSSDYTQIIIGITGSYKVNTKKTITSVIIPTATIMPNNDIVSSVNGSFTYSYFSSYQNTFDIVSDVNIYDVPAKQFIGENHKKDYNDNDLDLVNHNIITSLTDLKTTVTKYYDLLFQKRPVHTIYFKREENMLQLNESSFRYSQSGTSPHFYTDSHCTQPLSVNDDWDTYAVYEIKAMPLDNHDGDYTEGDFHRGEYYYLDRRSNEYYPWDQLKKITFDSPEDYRGNKYYLPDGSKTYTLDTGFRDRKSNWNIEYFESVWNPVTNQYEYKSIRPTDWHTEITSSKTDGGLSNDTLTLTTKRAYRNTYTQLTNKDNYDANLTYYYYPLQETINDVSTSTLDPYDKSITTNKLVEIEFSESGYQTLPNALAVGENIEYRICQYRWQPNKFYVFDGTQYILSTSYTLGTHYFLKDSNSAYHEVCVGDDDMDVYIPGLYYENLGRYYAICNDANYDKNKTYYISNNEYYNRKIKAHINDGYNRYYYADTTNYKANTYYLKDNMNGVEQQNIYCPIAINDAYNGNMTYYYKDKSTGNFIAKNANGNVFNATLFHNNQEMLKQIVLSPDRFIYLATTDTSYKANKTYYVKMTMGGGSIEYYRVATDLNADNWDPTAIYYEKHVMADYQLYMLLTLDTGYWSDRIYYKHYSNIYIDGKTQLFIPNYDTKFYYNLGFENENSKTDFTKFDNDEYNSIDLNEREYYELTNLDEVHDVYITPGVMLTIAYQQRVIDYNLEYEDINVKTAKLAYESALEDYYTDYDNDKIPAIKETYANFLSILSTALEEYKAAHAIDNDY